MVGADFLDWVRKRQARDEEFSERLITFRSTAYRLAMKIVGSADMAEDVAQAALMTAWKRRSTLADFGAFDAWLRKIVVHTAINSIKRTIPVAELQESMCTESISDETLQVAQVLSRLNAPYRVILALAIGEQLSYREIAETLGIPEGTVSSRLNAAKNAFRKVWEEE
jgi:RNA polymerase sigma-70 factor (ECF subfamily)